MKTITRRIRRLEDQLRPREGEALLITVSNGDWRLALDEDRCMQILGESGHLPTRGVGVVSFRKVPENLNAKELEKYLRKNGAGSAAPAAPEILRGARRA